MSNTYTLNFSYGLGLVADGTGVLLNNELDDFTAKPGAANAYELVGFNANLPGPGKRPLSSMTPTIVLKDGKPFLVTGSPGGSRIISAVLQVITNVIDFHMPIDRGGERAAAASTSGSRTRPLSSRAFRPMLLDALTARGHKIVPTEPHTSANSIVVIPKGEFTPQGYVGAADTAHPRRAGGGVLLSVIPGAREARDPESMPQRRDYRFRVRAFGAPRNDNCGRNLERAKGFEPSTPTLARSCSTPELHPHPLDIWPKWQFRPPSPNL